MALLTILQAADSLGCTGLHIERAISLGELKAATVGVDGPYRIDEKDFSAWGQAGYPRFDLPAPLDGVWYSGRHQDIDAQTANFREALGKLLDEWMNTQAEPAANVSSVTVTPTQAMRTLAAAPVPRLLAEIKTNKPKPAQFATRLEGAMVHATRAAARRLAQAKDNRRPPLSVLFKSKAQFAELSAQAVAQALTSNITGRLFWPAKSHFEQTHRVDYLLPLGSLVSGSAATFSRRIIELSF